MQGRRKDVEKVTDGPRGTSKSNNQDCALHGTPGLCDDKTLKSCGSRVVALSDVHFKNSILSEVWNVGRSILNFSSSER